MDIIVPKCLVSKLKGNEKDRFLNFCKIYIHVFEWLLALREGLPWRVEMQVPAPCLELSLKCVSLKAFTAADSLALIGTVGCILCELNVSRAFRCSGMLHSANEQFVTKVTDYCFVTLVTNDPTSLATFRKKEVLKLHRGKSPESHI